MRLQKFLARAGAASRRGSENLMTAGRVTVNGQVWQQYLDIGLYDTMQDLFVNFIGAVVFSIIGYIYIKNRGRGIAAEFIPTMDMEKFEEIKEEHQEELDHLLHEKLKLPKKNAEEKQTDDPDQE